MKILIAPDKFKGSLSAAEFCDVVKKAILIKLPDAEVYSLPLADGGEGFADAILKTGKYKKQELTVNDPLHRWVSSHFYFSENLQAIIEMAKASGLDMLSQAERNPLKTSTLGTGELIRRALDLGAKEVIIGIGGSATNDGGMGLAVALGYQFFDDLGNRLSPSGENIAKVARLVEPTNKPWKNCKIKVASDVSNTLYGSNGAAYIFAKQKGASGQVIKQLDDGLRSFSALANKHFGTRFHSNNGAGAAGGLGYGLMTFLGAELVSGIELILEANNFDNLFNNTDFVITGEGKIDSQTLAGKVVAGVVKKAKLKNIPVIGICGVADLNNEEKLDLGLSKIIELKSANNTIEQAMAKASDLLYEATLGLF
jgi:glycerate 2-kinase